MKRRRKKNVGWNLADLGGACVEYSVKFTEQNQANKSEKKVILIIL